MGGFRSALAAAFVTLALAAGPSAAETGLVAVDVGHTLSAPGATSARGRGEFEFNRDLAGQIASALGERGWEARMVNADGRIESLRARPQAAAGAAFLLSVHHDSVNAFELSPWTWEGRALDYSDEFAGHSLFVSRDNPDTAMSVLCARDRRPPAARRSRTPRTRTDVGAAMPIVNMRCTTTTGWRCAARRTHAGGAVRGRHPEEPRRGTPPARSRASGRAWPTRSPPGSRPACATASPRTTRRVPTCPTEWRRPGRESKCRRRRPAPRRAVRVAG